MRVLRDRFRITIFSPLNTCADRYRMIFDGRKSLGRRWRFPRLWISFCFSTVKIKKPYFEVSSSRIFIFFFFSPRGYLDSRGEIGKSPKDNLNVKISPGSRLFVVTDGVKKKKSVVKWPGRACDGRRLGGSLRPGSHANNYWPEEKKKNE